MKVVPIPKSGGGTRAFDVPTIADRIAQTVAIMILGSRRWSQCSTLDSYGYRPVKSALDAVEVCKQRCWRRPRMVDLDIQASSTTFRMRRSSPRQRSVTDLPWVVLYVKRRLVAPIHQPNGSCVVPVKGTPQGSAISPMFSNLFLHYAVDSWLPGSFRWCGLRGTVTMLSCTVTASGRRGLFAMSSRNGCRSSGCYVTRKDPYRLLQAAGRDDKFR